MKRNPRRVWELKIYVFAHAVEKGKVSQLERSKGRGERGRSHVCRGSAGRFRLSVQDSHPHPADVCPRSALPWREALELDCKSCQTKG